MHYWRRDYSKNTNETTDREIKQAINNIFGEEMISVSASDGATDGVVKHDRVAPEDESLSKYPAPKRDGHRKYPENMTVEAVRKMYIDEGKNRKAIAEYFGVKESTVNNFLFLHDIRRTKRKSKKPDPDDKERP